MRQEAVEVRNLAIRKKEDLKYKKIEFVKGNTIYEAVWKGFGTKAVKLEIYVSYDDIDKYKDSKPLEKELWERLIGEYTYKKEVTNDT